MIERQREQVKEKTRAVKTDIFETIEKIERGELIDLKIRNKQVEERDQSSEVISGSPNKVSHSNQMPGIFSLNFENVSHSAQIN